MSASTSIVIPVHNNAALTRICLDAVLGDLGRNREVIVVDDASTDSTGELLDGYGASIRCLTLASNGGYARACNEGAALAVSESLVFLNNDTEPRPGWLDALERHALAHPAAAALGAKLLYPTGAVQHAGVVIGQDGYPHNLYAGMPAEHPAVNRSRRLQAVTGACMLVRRAAFERVDGFDTGFVNSLEDVDLCLRLGEAGGEVHYCHEAVVVHLESASRGRRDRFERSVALYRERWRERVRRDDVSVYVDDDLLEFEYADSYPLRLSVSPRLATVDAGRDEEVEGLLETYARQVSDLLGEVVRLTAATGGDLGPAGELRPTSFADTVTAFDRREFVREASRLEGMVQALQQRLEVGTGPVAGVPPGPEFTANRQLGYRRLVEQVREAVAREVPIGASVLVVSRGDRELVDLGPRVCSHFPQDSVGGYLGHHPGDSAEAIARLEELRAAGAEYLVLPATSSWWLDHYAGFASHLRRRYPATESDACTIFELGAVAADSALREVAG
ncbi:MAG TPA: glycosyltransferase family 2 protein [Solirubrobacterales bacterium]|nr:glycosyltransferase family 2 protein [Solirubrobacterales bacterium]